jgi:hypothetical protein
MSGMPVSTVGLPDLPGWHVRRFADDTYDGVNGRMTTGRHDSPAGVRIAIERGSYLRADNPSRKFVPAGDPARADTSSLVPGTYVRESDGAGHIYHSVAVWRDPSYALARADGYTGGSADWRIVRGSEHDAVWTLTHLAPGESWTYDGPGDDAAPQWVLIENTPGYLPEDDEPATFTELDDAREYLRERVAEYVEHLHEGTDWRADYEPGVSVADDALSAYVTDPDRIHDLGRSFEILPIETN